MGIPMFLAERVAFERYRGAGGASPGFGVATSQPQPDPAEVRAEIV